MGKLLAVTITGLAFLVAVYLVLFHQRIPEKHPGSILQARFWVLVTLFVTFLGGGPGSSVAAPKAKTVQGLTTQNRTAIRDRTEWKAIRADWLAVEKIEQFGWDEMNKSVEKAKKNCGQQLALLSADGLVTKEGAVAFCQVHTERIYHKLRKTAASCYDPTTLGLKVQYLRDDFEQRLKALAKVGAAKKLTPQVIDKTRRAILKQMELALRIKAHWDAQPKDGKWEAYRKREQEIMALFAKDDYKTVDIKDEIQIRPGVEEAMGLVQLIYSR